MKRSPQIGVNILIFYGIMNKCWAQSLGGCNGISGEHIFSNSIFKAGCGCPIVIAGVMRIRGGEPTRGAEKSNILCQHHNSILSPLDATIGKVSKFQAQANDEGFENTLWLEGELLERWLLKTVINMAAAGWLGQQKLLPSVEIVRAIFGFENVPNKIGLYIVEGICPSHRPSGGTSFKPVSIRTPMGLILGGAYISVNGMSFFVSLNADIVARLESSEIPEFKTYFSKSGLKHLYHPGAIFMDRKKGSRLYIGLSWGGYLRFADGSITPFPLEK